MALPENVDRLCEFIKKIAKEIEHKYNYHLRKQDIKASLELNDCAAQLAVCENEFVKSIRIQCKSVRDAREGGFNETPQKQIVMDSAVGYLLVREARFAISTIRSFDSLNIAYDMLENAALTIQGRKESAKSALAKLVKSRPGYEYIYSSEAYEEKCDIVKDMLEELIRTGDIEECVKRRNSHQKKSAAARAPRAAARNDANSSDYDEDKFKNEASALNSMYDDEPEPDLSGLHMSDLGIDSGKL